MTSTATRFSIPFPFPFPFVTALRLRSPARSHEAAPGTSAATRRVDGVHGAAMREPSRMTDRCRFRVPPTVHPAAGAARCRTVGAGATP